MNQPLPPENLMAWTGSGDPAVFQAVGREFAGYLIERLHLRADGRLLDLGCGCGRIALPLLDHLSERARYEGLDVDAGSIAWARASIRHPAFHFTHADVYNTVYNRRGSKPAHRYRLPYADNSFDAALLASVFTHMLPPGLENYLAEVARTLAPGGQALMTFFLMNDESGRLIRAGRSQFQFPHRWGAAAVQSRRHPESVVGYDEAAVMGLLESNGLEMVGTPDYGQWCGREAGTSFQDIVVCRKVRSMPPRVSRFRWPRIYWRRNADFVAGRGPAAGAV